MTIVVSQPYFDYTNYPLDSQWIVLRYSPFAYSSQFFQMTTVNPAVSYVDVNGDKNFVLNPIWKHEENDYTSETYLVT